MSHIATVDVEITDLKSLAKAAKACGVTLFEGVTDFRYYGGRRAPCEHVLRADHKPSAYEIGLVRRPDGRGWTLSFDPFGRGCGMMDCVSSEQDKGKRGVGRLMQEYAKQVSIKELKRAGFRVSEKKEANGSVRLVCSR